MNERITSGSVKRPATAEEALQLLLNVSAFLMEHGRVETGTPESMTLRFVYEFFARQEKVVGQLGHVRPNPSFVFQPTEPNDARLIETAIAVLQAPRNRYGKLQPTNDISAAVHGHARRFGGLPHGGADLADKTAMVLQRMLGREATSICDVAGKKS